MGDPTIKVAEQIRASEPADLCPQVFSLSGMVYRMLAGNLVDSLTDLPKAIF